MTDKELLEFAAKAAAAIGVPIIHSEAGPQILERKTPDGVEFYRLWVPLTDDGDALRLAVRLGLIVSVQHGESWAQSYETPGGWLTRKESHDGDSCAATRRAIVRAAAKIGKQKG